MSRTRRFPVDSAPAPIGRSWDVPLNALTLTFDKPLVNQAHAAANWTLTKPFPPNAHPLTATSVTATTIRLQFGGHAGTGALDIIYAASPADVVGVNGLAVGAFTFPVAP